MGHVAVATCILCERDGDSVDKAGRGRNPRSRAAQPPRHRQRLRAYRGSSRGQSCGPSAKLLLLSRRPNSRPGPSSEVPKAGQVRRSRGPVLLSRPSDRSLCCASLQPLSVLPVCLLLSKLLAPASRRPLLPRRLGLPQELGLMKPPALRSHATTTYMAPRGPPLCQGSYVPRGPLLLGSSNPPFAYVIEAALPPTPPCFPFARPRCVGVRARAP